MTVADVRFLMFRLAVSLKLCSALFLREGVGRCFRSEICSCDSRNVQKHDSPVCAETSL